MSCAFCEAENVIPYFRVEAGVTVCAGCGRPVYAGERAPALGVWYDEIAEHTVGDLEHARELLERHVKDERGLIRAGSIRGEHPCRRCAARARVDNLMLADGLCPSCRSFVILTGDADVTLALESRYGADSLLVTEYPSHRSFAFHNRTPRARAWLFPVPKGGRDE